MSTDNWWRERSLWFVLWYAARNYWFTVGSVWAMYAPWHERANRDAKHAYCSAPWWAWPLHLIAVVPFFAFEQAYGCFLVFERQWPLWPMDTATRVHFAVGRFIERHVTSFSYLAPDSGDPDEIGFHYRADLLTLDRDTYEYVNRPRVFNRSGPGDTWVPTS